MKRPRIEPLRRLLPPLLVTLALFAAPPPADTAAVYRWTDAQGIVHFSDRPDDAPGAERIEVRPPPAVPAPPRGEAPAEDASRTPLQPDARAQAAIREKNCAIARDTLAHNEAIDRMYRLGANGERIFLTDEERAALMQRSHDDVTRWCD